MIDTQVEVNMVAAQSQVGVVWMVHQNIAGLRKVCLEEVLVSSLLADQMLGAKTCS